MARFGKVLLVCCCAAALLAVAFAAETEPSTLSKVLDAPRRILRGYGAYRRMGPMMWPRTYGWGGGWGYGSMMMPYQENRWVSASRMDTSTDRRFNMVSKK